VTIHPIHAEKEKIQFNKKYSALFNLKNRSIISVSGQDSTSFLQSMITNDMKLFDKDEERAAIYGLFLNPKGRILYDAIIIKSQLYIYKEFFIKANLSIKLNINTNEFLLRNKFI